MKKIMVSILCLCLVLSGCAARTAEPSGTIGGEVGLNIDPTETPTETPTTEPVPTEPYEEPVADPEDDVIDVGQEDLAVSEEELYQQLFDLNNKIEIDIDMSDTELQKLQQDYKDYRDRGSKSPIYRRADMTVTINGTAYRVRDVGVRMKGNTSRTSFYSQEEGIYNAIHLKLDFQETFDDEEYYGAEALNWASEEERDARKDRTFATLEKLELRWNKCYDSTYLRELYAYELYRDQGVLAPLVNLCSMDWSGVQMGIYTLNEPVDEIFLEKRLPAEDLGGDLYKCGWTHEGASLRNMNSIGIEDEDKGEFYCYDLKSNKKSSQHESLTELMQALNSAILTEERFAELVDVDSFISYAAVSYFLGNPDDLRNNYNNYYIYFLKSSGKMVIIPYDYDRCLGVTVEYNPSGHAMTVDDPFSDLREGAQGGPAAQDVPLYSYTVVKGGWYVAQYADALVKVSQSDLLKIETFRDYFDRAKSLYGNDVTPSKTLRNAEGRDFSFDLDRTSAAWDDKNMSFSDYITEKMASFNGYMDNLDYYLSYQRPGKITHYIRGDFNYWTNDDRYGMTNEDGILTFTLSFSHDFSFKIYDDLSQAWYGTECLEEGSDLEYTTDDHTNFDMKAGTYYITFDPETLIITVTKQ